MLKLWLYEIVHGEGSSEGLLLDRYMPWHQASTVIWPIVEEESLVHIEEGSKMDPETAIILDSMSLAAILYDDRIWPLNHVRYY